MTHVWRGAMGADRLVVDVEWLALQYSAQRYPNDAIKAVKGDQLQGFEGALYPLGAQPSGWAIIYNNANVSPERRRFTLAHEFGHYLVHRHLLPDGIECDAKKILRREGVGIEKEADEFAAALLMPADDFRSRIKPTDKPSIEDLSGCAGRYGVSFTAAALRWLELTDRRAVLVVSIDGGALWAKSSKAAFDTYRFIRTKNETFLLPDASAAVQDSFGGDGRSLIMHRAGVWFPEATEEHSFKSKRDGQVISVLHLPNVVGRGFAAAPDLVDTYERLTTNQR